MPTPPPPLLASGRDAALASSLALFLDFDGTLVDLADTPEGVLVPEGLVPLLAELQMLLGGALAVVTGRQIDVLDAFLAPLSLPAAGEHGVQRRDAQGRLRSLPSPDLAAVREAAEALASTHAGLRVEVKPAAIALHYRQAPALEGLCRDLLTRTLGERTDLELLHGKFVFEVKRAGVHKGQAIAAFLQEPPFAGRTPVFAGDDTTDEHGFDAVQSLGGTGFKVGDGKSRAAQRIASPAAVRDALAALRDALAEQNISRRSPA